MRFVYGFIPFAGTVDQLIKQEVYELAKKIVLRTNHNTMLENQAISKESIDQSIQELASELKQEIRKSLWD